ncbi:hypothetical protein JFK97_11000 [Chromobacterium phragmitis]|uniref:hypothetical protein n=1 Tax=Chromobacterium amazonense TaxID=1382803 RepID=UPI0021B7FB32|nr:hypothetical protein [Chromobacterium amazonense]MBM2884915.1 hypothetical protein [Chromobacterium amazonense]
MEKSYLYEFLVRGTPSGIAGAHVIYAADAKNVLTGEARTEIGAAQPVALIADKPGCPIADVVGAVNVAALAEIEQLREQVRARDAELAEAKQQLQGLEAELAALKARPVYPSIAPTPAGESA